MSGLREGENVIDIRQATRSYYGRLCHALVGQKIPELRMTKQEKFAWHYIKEYERDLIPAKKGTDPEMKFEDLNAFWNWTQPRAAERVPVLKEDKGNPIFYEMYEEMRDKARWIYTAYYPASRRAETLDQADLQLHFAAYESMDANDVPFNEDALKNWWTETGRDLKDMTLKVCLY